MGEAVSFPYRSGSEEHVSEAPRSLSLGGNKKKFNFFEMSGFKIFRKG